MQDSAAVRRIEGAGNLQGDGEGGINRHGPTQRRTVDVLEYQVVWADIVQLTDVGMVQRRNGPSFALKPPAPVGVPREGLGQDLNRDVTAEPRIASLVHVAHAAGAQRHEDLIRSKQCARRKRHDVVGARNQACIVAASARRTRRTPLLQGLAAGRVQAVCRRALT